MAADPGRDRQAGAITASHLPRAFAYLLPYWRRLSLVVLISLISTATTLAIPYLSKDLIDTALVGRDAAALARIVWWFVVFGVFGFVLNVVSGLRYTRVSADILFDMRLSLYQHLQRLSPRFYARTRLDADAGALLRFAALQPKQFLKHAGLRPQNRKEWIVFRYVRRTNFVPGWQGRARPAPATARLPRGYCVGVFTGADRGRMTRLVVWSAFISIVRRYL